MSPPTNDASAGNMLYKFEYDQTFLAFMENANTFIRLLVVSVAPSIVSLYKPCIQSLIKLKQPKGPLFLNYKIVENQICWKLMVLKTSLYNKDSKICDVNFIAFKIMA